MNFLLHHHAFGEGPENLALEEVLLRPFLSTPAQPRFRLWHNPSPCIVIGRGEKPAERVHLERAREAGVPVWRRSSGGGTVVHGPGNLNLSFFIPYDLHPDLRNISASQKVVLNWVQEALDLCTGRRPELRGSGDLCLEGKKISGTAQARKKHGLLHHLTLLVDFDLAGISQLLLEPDKRPEYRGERKHGDFVTDLAQQGLLLDEQQLLDAFSKVLGEDSRLVDLDQECLDQAHALAQAKYRQASWNEDGREPRP